MEEECLFCRVFSENERIVFDTRQFFVVYDAFPVNRGHMLIIPKRHAENIFDLDTNEWEDLAVALYRTKLLLGAFNPDGYNIGINCGEAAGQTIFHLHIHVIPRYQGDVKNPRGGIRNFMKPLKRY